MPILANRKPIRVALAGLSAAARTSWAAAAHLPYLKAAEKEGTYKIVALLNSNKAAAENAIKTFGLDENTKAYGSAEEVAANPDIDLVVALTRVDVHWSNVKPSIAAGKSIYIEWPMAKDLNEAKEIVDAVHKASLPVDRTFIGLQARLDPTFQLLARLISMQKRLGKVHSVDFRGVFMFFSPIMSASIDYFNDLEIGGNMASIYLLHHLDPILYSLGQADIAELSSHLLTGHKHVKLLEGPFRGNPQQLKVSDEHRKRNTHDQIIFHGRLISQLDVVDGALITVHTRGDKAFKDDPTGGVSLRIYGERGEIHISSSSGGMSAGLRGKDIDFKLYDIASDKVETFPVIEEVLDSNDVTDSLDLSSLPLPSRNIGRLYEMFRKRQAGYATVEDALHRHGIIESVYQNDMGKRQS